MSPREHAADRLACGTELATLADQVAELLPAADPEHQGSCPHCRAALGELGQLWGAVRDVAREDIALPAALVEKAIRRVRRELLALGRVVPEATLEAVVPRLVRHALLGGPRGVTRIADDVVARLVARVVRETPGVHALGGGFDILGTGRARRLAPRGVAVEVEGHRVAVEVRLVAEYGRSIPSLADRVRSRVIAHVEKITGLEPVSVDVTAEDVYGAPEPAPRRFRPLEHPESD